MAKRRMRTLPARKANRSNDDSLLLRSAESLGRVIGTLQRQVQGGTKRLAAAANDAMDAIPEIPSVNDLVGPRRKPRKPARARKSAGARKTSAARKTGSTRKRTASRKATALKR